MKTYLTVLFLLCSILSCSAIKCYQGYTEHIPGTTGLKTKTETDCASGVTTCTKTVTSALGIKGNVYGCGSSGDTSKGCSDSSIAGVAEETVCVCSGNLCNGADSARSAAGMMVMVAMVVVAVVVGADWAV